MEFSTDRHHTLFHIDDRLDHISKLLLCHVVQLVPGHGISNFVMSILSVSPRWGNQQTRLRIVLSPVNKKSLD